MELAQPGLTAGRQAGRQAGEIQVNFEIFKTHSTLRDLTFHFI